MAVLDIDNLDAGDDKYHLGREFTFPTDGNVSAGDAVTFNGSGNLTTTTANDDTLIGCVSNVSAPSDDNWPVKVGGYVVVHKGDSGISRGDTLVPSGSNNGNLASHGSGTYYDNPDTGASDIAANHPIALSSTSSDGDLVLAMYR